MEQYEVDLRDYLQVFQRGKWIILISLAVAIGIAAVISYRLPDVYSVSAVLAIKVIPSFPKSFAIPTPQEVIERARDHRLLIKALENPERAVWFLKHAEFKAEDALVFISLKGPLSPPELTSMLDAVVAELENAYAGDLADAVAIRLAEIALRRKTIKNQIAEWQTFVDDAYRKAREQRKDILSEIEQIERSPSLLRLEVGENNRTLEGALAVKKLELLFSRLQPVEALCDGVDRVGILYFEQISDRYLSVKAELLSLQEEEESLQMLLKSDSMIRVVCAPEGSGEPVWPDRPMNLAVAGVLGLFVGILLAFLWHWLREPAAGEDGKTDPGS